MTPDTKTRLIKLLGMMGSIHDGEILNAARLAHRLVKEAGLTWEQAIGGITGEQLRKAEHNGFNRGYEVASAKYRTPTWRALCETLLEDYADALTPWEEGFVQNFLERRWGSPTERQREIFTRIGEKCGVTLPE
jgi:hypothetical protein